MTINRERLIRVAYLAIALSVSILVLALLRAWFASFAPTLRDSFALKDAISPMISEAKLLHITYDSVIASPAQALGKPAIWCIQNRGGNSINYKGDENKRIVQGDGEAIPLFYGSKHSACQDMLVRINGVRNNSTVSGSTYTFVEVQYISSI